MKTTMLFLVAALSADPDLQYHQTIYRPSPQLAAAVRGQSPNFSDFSSGTGYEELPPPGQSSTSPLSIPGPSTFSGGAPAMPYESPATMGDPFLSQQIPGASPYPGNGYPGGAYPGTPPLGSTFGANGPQPYRFGWTPRGAAGYLTKESTEPGLGGFEIFEVDTELQYRAPAPDGSIFSLTPEFNYRGWEGPSGIGLPPDVYRIATSVGLSTPAHGPWSSELVFTPFVATDFDQGLDSDSWFFDGHGILFYRTSPHWMWAFGAGYWDRVHDRVIPYAGAVWTPDDRWEWRLLFPKPRISYFMGNVYGIASWLYVRGEYHIEAYQITLEPTGPRTQIEIEDWRVLLGIRSDNGFAASFLEAGWVFGRHARFKGLRGFDISSGFIARAGVRF